MLFRYFSPRTLMANWICLLPFQPSQRRSAFPEPVPVSLIITFNPHSGLLAGACARSLKGIYNLPERGICLGSNASLDNAGVEIHV